MALEDADEVDLRDDEAQLLAPIFSQSVFSVRFFLSRKHLTDFFFQFRPFLDQQRIIIFFSSFFVSKNKYCIKIISASIRPEIFVVLACHYTP